MSSEGTPKGNRIQNKQFTDAIREIEKLIGRKLSKREVRRLHDAISGQNYSYHEIIEEGLKEFDN
jgi:hypothetical protein